MLYNKNEAGNLLPKVFTFNPNNQPVQVEVINNEPWFVAKDVCDCLGISNVTESIRNLDVDEKMPSVVLRASKKVEVNLVNESGLYNLIFQSRKPEAKAFRKWVTSEVLPAIRRTGGYTGGGHASRRNHDYVDLRHIPYEYKRFEHTHVRVVNYQDINWFSVNDIFRCIGCASCPVATTASINAINPGHAIKIFLYGNTHPAWFTTLTGAQLIISGSRKLKNNKQQVHQLQIVIGG